MTYNLKRKDMEEKYYEILRHYVNPNDCATVVKQLLSLHNVVVPKGTLCCPECKSADLKVAIHTDYKECNKCYHYWET